MVKADGRYSFHSFIEWPDEAILRTHWVKAVEKGFIPLDLAKDTVEIMQSML